MVVPLLAMYLVSLAAFKIFSSMLLSSSLTMMCAGVVFFWGGGAEDGAAWLVGSKFPDQVSKL